MGSNISIISIDLEILKSQYNSECSGTDLADETCHVSSSVLKVSLNSTFILSATKVYNMSSHILTLFTSAPFIR